MRLPDFGEQFSVKQIFSGLLSFMENFQGRNMISSIIKSGLYIGLKFSIAKLRKMLMLNGFSSFLHMVSNVN